MHEINKTFDLVSLAGKIVNLHKTAGRYYIGACPFCGGRDRFNVKHTNGGDLWICRKCTPEKYQDAVSFVMRYYNVKFPEAVKRMGGELRPDPSRAPLRVERKPELLQVIPPQEWQARAWKAIDRASDRLIDGPEGKPGRDYLTARGINRASMYVNLLGFDPAKYDPVTERKRPAVVIPWLDVGNVVTAVKYRFIDDLARDKSKRFIAMGGGIPCVYGLQNVLADDETLLIVEGELNAVSVLQVMPRGVSVVSMGSDTGGNAAIIQALAKHYKKVVIWMDDPHKIKDMRGKIARNDAKLLKSPVIDGVKYDANEMLKGDLLRAFLDDQLAAVCVDWDTLPREVERIDAKNL